MLRESNNKHCQVTAPGSSGLVQCNGHTSISVGCPAVLNVQDNQHCRLRFAGGDLKLTDSKHSDVSGRDNDLDIADCKHFSFSGERNKGNFGDCKHWKSTGNDNELAVLDCSHFYLSSSNTTVFAEESRHFSILNCLNGKVALLRASHVTVSGKDFTLEAADLTKHTFFGSGSGSGEGDSGDKISHKLTFVPSKTFTSSSPTIMTIINGVITWHGNGNNTTNCKTTWSPSLQFCNAAKVVENTWEIGGLPLLTIDIQEEGKARIKVTEDVSKAAECKVISENGKKILSISSLTEELKIEGIKDVASMQVQDKGCEYVVNLEDKAAVNRGNGTAYDDDIYNTTTFHFY